MCTKNVMQTKHIAFKGLSLNTASVSDGKLGY